MFARKTNRLQSYDYSYPGYYFVTICVQGRAECFGEIVKGRMVLNRYGEIAEKFWKEAPKHYPFIDLDEFIVMPNHVHGIVIMRQQVPADGRRYNLAQIVSSYKNIVSKIIHQQDFTSFTWQHSYYDHVIRQDESLATIREYIRNNPLKWDLDRNNPENVWV